MKPLSVDTQGILGVIHARGGSKRIPLKNMKLLAGRPLISYLVEAAMESRLLDRLIVSTDHPEIARMSARQALDQRGLSTRLVIAQQKTPTEVFTF